MRWWTALSPATRARPPKVSFSTSIDSLLPPFLLALRAELRAVCLTPFCSSACIVYGQQELGMFSTHVGDTCLMPFHQYEGQSGRLIATALHLGKTPTAKAIIGILRRVVKKLRIVWPRLPLVFRADGQHSKSEVLAWLERAGLHYVIGYAPNAVLKRQFAACIQQATKRYEQHVKQGRAEVETRAFASGSYSTGSWGGDESRRSEAAKQRD